MDNVSPDHTDSLGSNLVHTELSFMMQCVCLRKHPCKGLCRYSELIHTFKTEIHN
jgi:hypothetical protein